ncbi:MAG TPA: hypothetical protein PLI01_00365 [Nitrospira sp.]|nr:hypothetical protein [Nitrospira sp.]HNA25212.1 hypothetical protein [Nitrospira sp.]HNI17502.1 hypothetical protein [Nitrospira sp.]
MADSQDTANLPGAEGTSGETTPTEPAKDGEAGSEKVVDPVKPDAGKQDDNEYFHVEGDVKFKTKEEFLEHAKKRIGDASRVIGENFNLRKEIEELKGGKQPQKTDSKDGGNTPAEEFSDEEKAVLQKLGKVFLSREDLEKLLSERLSDISPVVNRIRSQEQQSANDLVAEFMQANPDALAIANDLASAVEKLGSSGLQVDLYDAYRLLTKKEPVRPSQEPPKKDDTEEEKTKIKQAQAGGAPSGAAGKPAKKGDDFFAGLFRG